MEQSSGTGLRWRMHVHEGKLEITISPLVGRIHECAELSIDLPLDQARDLAQNMMAATIPESPLH